MWEPVNRDEFPNVNEMSDRHKKLLLWLKPSWKTSIWSRSQVKNCLSVSARTANRILTQLENLNILKPYNYEL